MKREFKVIPGGQTADKHIVRKQNRRKRRVFIFVILAVLVLAISQSFGILRRLIVDTEVVRHSLHVAGNDVQVVIIRREHVVLTPAAGTYEPGLPTGQRIRVNQSVGAISSSAYSREILAPASGLIVHGTDGWEQVLQLGMPLNPETTSGAAFLLDNPAPPIDFNSELSAGDPVAVIVDNYNYQLLTPLSSFPEDASRSFMFTDPQGQDMRVRMRVADSYMNNNIFWVLWSGPSLPDWLGTQRIVEAVMVVSEQVVTEMPVSVLSYEDGKAGVYALRKGRPVFVEVEAYEVDGKRVRFTGIREGEEVIIVPEWASFTKRWWIRK